MAFTFTVQGQSSPLLFLKSKMKSLSPVLASLALLLVLSFTSLASTNIKCKTGIPVLSIESSMVLALQSFYFLKKFSFFSVPLWRGGLPSHHHLRPARWQRFFLIFIIFLFPPLKKQPHFKSSLSFLLLKFNFFVFFFVLAGTKIQNIYKQTHKHNCSRQVIEQGPLQHLLFQTPPPLETPTLAGLTAK